MILLYYGEDAWGLGEEFKKLKNKFLASHPDGAVEEIVCRTDTSDQSLSERLRAALENQGLFSQKKFVVLRGALEHISSLKNSEAYLHEVSENPPSDFTLMLLEPESFDKRLKLYKKLQKKATLKEFTVPRGKLLVSWIQKRVAEMECKIAPDASDELLNRLGERLTLSQIDSELNKLVLYAGKSKRITREHVKNLVATTVSHDVFALTNLVAEGNITKAVWHLEEMITGITSAEQKSQIIQIIGALASQIRSLLLVKSLEGKSTTEIAKILGWKEGRVYINLKLSAKFTTNKLTGLMRDLKSIDFRLKTSEEPPKLLLTLFLQKAKA